MNRGILYFVVLIDEVKFVYEHKKERVKGKYLKILNKTCLEYMTTVEGRIKAMSTFWGSRYNVPIYINEDICFLKVDQNVWINVNNVEKIVEKCIVFTCGMSLYFEASKRNLEEKIKRLKSIIKNVKK